MPSFWTTLAGDTSQFAVKIELQRDPDRGAGATVEESLSWGRLEIWVDGINICAHLQGDQTIHGVQWYLLDFFEWIVSGWDELLHEERLPFPAPRSASAWASLRETRFPPELASDDIDSRWRSDWKEWWRVHSMQAARFGGVFPDVVFRRWRGQSIEVSWGPTATPGAAPNIRFLAPEGVSRLPLELASNVLFSVTADFSQQLLRMAPESDRIRTLNQNVAGLRSASRHWNRIAILAGLGRRLDFGIARLKGLSDALGRSVPGAADRLFGPEESGLFVDGRCTAGLAFGSLSPNVDEDDLLLLATFMAKAEGPEETWPLQQYEDHHEPSPDLRAAWREGYELALDLHDSLSDTDVMARAIASPVDINGLLSSLGVDVQSVRLTDKTVRAVALSSPTIRPTILLNSGYGGTASTEATRFTLAHELCHLLHDGGTLAPLAVASGPWAPRDVERRANAFAAMLLMPTHLVRGAIEQVSSTPKTKVWASHIADRFGVSYSACVEHLHNLGLLREHERDRLRPNR